VVLDAVLDVLAPGLDHGEAALGVVGGQGPGLGGDRGAEVDEDESPAAGPFDGAKEAVVVLLVDDDVGGGVGAEAVAPDPPGAAGLVERGVEDRAVVAGPGHAVVGAGDGLGV